MRCPAIIAATTLLCVLTGPALAEKLDFALSLGARQIGKVVFDGGLGSGRLLATMDNTPLGVADGSFQAMTNARGQMIRYESRSRGGKQRDIAVTRTAGQVTQITVIPPQDATTLSDAAQVPRGVISLTEAFALMALGQDCPDPMTVHDGRRVVRIATAARSASGSEVRCKMSYHVLKGPGHLSPFRFKALGMRLAYGAGALRRITMSAGGFEVTLTRLD